MSPTCLWNETKILLILNSPEQIIQNMIQVYIYLTFLSSKNFSASQYINNFINNRHNLNEYTTSGSFGIHIYA